MRKTKESMLNDLVPDSQLGSKRKKEADYGSEDMLTKEEVKEQAEKLGDENFVMDYANPSEVEDFDIARTMIALKAAYTAYQEIEEKLKRAVEDFKRSYA